MRTPRLRVERSDLSPATSQLLCHGGLHAAQLLRKSGLNWGPKSSLDFSQLSASLPSPTSSLLEFQLPHWVSTSHCMPPRHEPVPSYLHTALPPRSTILTMGSGKAPAKRLQFPASFELQWTPAILEPPSQDQHLPMWKQPCALPPNSPVPTKTRALFLAHMVGFTDHHWAIERVR
jgi:hypothetical protein